MNLYSALYYKPITSKALTYGPCLTMGSHSFTCHPCIHEPYLPLLLNQKALPPFGWYSFKAYPRRDGQA